VPAYGALAVPMFPAPLPIPRAWRHHCFSRRSRAQGSSGVRDGGVEEDAEAGVTEAMQSSLEDLVADLFMGEEVSDEALEVCV
jgi:hypothetical protein